MKKILPLLLLLPMLVAAGFPNPGTLARTSKIAAGGGGGCSFPTGCDAYWKMDEGTPTYVDFFTGNNLVTGIAPASTTGIIGNCGDYVPGEFDYVLATDSADISAGSNVDFSVSVWVWVDDLSVVRWIYGKDAGGTPEYALAVNTDGTIFLRINGGGGGTTEFTSTGTIPTSAWRHVVWTYDQSNYRIYIQGSLDSTHSSSTDINDSNNDLDVGRSPGAGGAHYDGRIDELGIWSGKALDGTEVSNLYCSGAGLQP